MTDGSVLPFGRLRRGDRRRDQSDADQLYPPVGQDHRRELRSSRAGVALRTTKYVMLLVLSGVLACSGDSDGPLDDSGEDAGEGVELGSADAGPEDTSSCEGVACIFCEEPEDCPGRETACQTRACLDNMCGTEFLPVGTAIANQTPGDCREVVCDGAGGTIASPVQTDAPSDDGNECTTASCVDGEPTVSANVGLACAGGTGRCNDEGRCVELCAMIDPPDLEGVDDNGDGIDGLAGCSVFVDGLSGDDAGSGVDSDDPVATIARGIQIASGFSPPRPVLVAGGTYAETLTLASGVSVFGGYDGATWARDPSTFVTIVQGTTARAVVAEDLTAPVTLQALTIRGASFADGGQSPTPYGSPALARDCSRSRAAPSRPARPGPASTASTVRGAPTGAMGPTARATAPRARGVPRHAVRLAAAAGTDAPARPRAARGAKQEAIPPRSALAARRA